MDCGLRMSGPLVNSGVGLGGSIMPTHQRLWHQWFKSRQLLCSIHRLQSSVLVKAAFSGQRLSFGYLGDLQGLIQWMEQGLGVQKQEDV